MRLAYLTNHYPAVSHSFIRREILAIEQAGHNVDRYSLRPPSGDFPDPMDRMEAERTFAILGQGAAALATACLAILVRNPVQWLKTLGMALSLRNPGLRSLVRHCAYFAEACLLARRLARHPVDHLHAHFGTNPAAVALLVRRLGGPPYSFTAHGMDEVEHAEALRIGTKIAEAEFAVGVSAYVRSQLLRWTDLSHWDKVKVVHCGLDGGFLADGTETDPPNAPALCYVGRLSREKGLPLLIEAAADLKRRGITFKITIIGDGPMRGLIEDQIRHHDLSRHVQLLGSCESKAVRDHILGSRALVLPSFAEGLPVVIMEALALGRPVIATAIAGIPELVDHECGWLVAPGAVQDLADAMNEALTAPVDSLMRMGEVGRARVRERHDIRRNVEALIRLFAMPLAAVTPDHRGSIDA